MKAIIEYKNHFEVEAKAKVQEFIFLTLT